MGDHGDEPTLEPPIALQLGHRDVGVQMNLTHELHELVAQSAMDRLPSISQFQGSIKRAGSPVGNLTAGSVTYSNNLEKIETIRDDGLIEGADPTIAALTGRIDVRFADTTLIDLASGGTPVDLEFAYTLSAQAKLVLTAHEVYLPKPKLAVEGPGGVQASFDFRGAKNDAAGQMLTVTLTNDLDGTEYA